MKKIKIKYSWWIACLLLASTVQMSAVDYKSTYKGMQKERQQTEYKVATTATTPAVGFQSTSAYSGQLDGGEQPMLNSDGTVNDGAYMSGSAHRAGRLRRADGDGDDDDENITNPGDPEEEGDTGNADTPIGDAVLPLMMLLGAYAGYKVLARKRA